MPPSTRVGDCFETGIYVNKNQLKLQPFKKILEEMSIENGIILRGEKVVIPEELQKEIIQIAHETHVGRLKTAALIKETMWFPAIERKVNEELDKPQQRRVKGLAGRDKVLDMYTYDHNATAYEKLYEEARVS